MFFRSLITIIVSCLLWMTSLLGTPTALAVTNIKLYDLSYHECPPELAEGNVTSGGGSAPASCYIIAGKAENKSGKAVYDADVFGRIYDANNEPMMQNRGRVGNLPEVPIGVSDFEIRITVPANQPTPLKLEQFKASGFTGAVRW